MKYSIPKCIQPVTNAHQKKVNTYLKNLDKARGSTNSFLHEFAY